MPSSQPLVLSVPVFATHPASCLAHAINGLMSVPIATTGLDFMKVICGKRNAKENENLWVTGLEHLILRPQNSVFPSVYNIPQRMPLRRAAVVTDTFNYTIEHHFKLHSTGLIFADAENQLLEYLTRAASTNLILIGPYNSENGLFD